MLLTKTSTQEQVAFLNPHCSHIGKIVSHIFNGKPNYKRYRHFAFSKYRNFEAVMIFNGQNSSFRRHWIRKILSFRIFIWTEPLIWIFINLINPLKTPVIFSNQIPKNLQKLVIFGTDVITYSEDYIKKIEEFNGEIFIHMTHYYINPSKLSAILMRLRKPVLVSDGLIENNAFFRYHFGSQFKHVQIPFLSNPRFESHEVEFHERKNMCLVVGSVPRILNRDFVNFFGQMNYLHPMRRILYMNQEKYPNEFVCHGRYNHSTKICKQNSCECEFTYDSFNIVNEYKNYSMFISPEESIGLPSVNFIDGMNSGSVYFGSNIELYESFGMKPGIHYVAYEHLDLSDLVCKVRYYQKNPYLLANIAESGRSLVAETFSEKDVVLRLNKLFS